MNSTPQPGAVIELRSATWKVLGTSTLKLGYSEVHCRGLSGLVRDKEARFVWNLEKDARVLDPTGVHLVPDTSPGLNDIKLHLEAAFRHTPTTTRRPITLGRAAIDDLTFQHLPVERALAQDRVRLLIADDVGLGKTLEAGLIASELALRGRANRILVVTTRAMLTQFQKEFWTRFSIPLARLDSAAIRRMRNRIPAHYNVFDQFDRSIVSIDTLKRDAQIRDAIRHSYWDLIIIDEAHNAAVRKNTTGTNSQRADLARLLSRRTDSLLLLTATPHDGSQESFASLIEMLDPTRVPDPSRLHRSDIEDLVVRRFRSSPEVVADIGREVPKRELFRRSFPLSPQEELAYQSVADLHLDLDEESSRGRAIDLFRTTLAKAIFSSPAACRETLERRIRGIENGTARGTLEDRDRLLALAGQVDAIDTGAFSKYQNLLQLLRDLRWTGRDPRDRLVIFSERIATVSWLSERLRGDLGLSEEQVARVDGGSVEAEVRTQQVIEAFGQERSPVRILIASDMASEGLNLHFQCHRLFHFDLPWSLLRFQQRNGRIDRYGQDRPPQITYFVGESTHPKVRQMWVLEKLVAKDVAAQEGVGDPAVFLGAGDTEGEEIVVAEAVAAGIGADAFEVQMDVRAAEAATHLSLDDEFAALFGDYATPVPRKAEVAADLAPPRLFKDTFTYATAMIERLSRPEECVFADTPSVVQEERMIRMTIPEDMRARDGFGYASEGAVDGRYMPEEAVGPGDRIELTDQAQVINQAIDQAKMQERSWPTVQYLWDGHPILEWFADRASTFFPEHAAPVAYLHGRLEPGEVAVILHGAVPNANGAPVVDRWAVVVRTLDGKLRIEEVPDFLSRTRFADNTPSRPIEDLDAARGVIPAAVDRFQTHLVDLRRAREADIQRDLDDVLDRLAALETRFKEQLTLDLGDLLADEEALSPAEKRRLTLRRAKEQKIERLFQDWTEWFERTRRMVADPNPYVDVKAVLVG
ncbi:DEAD/DEAH box helicase [Hyphomonas atlantica]|uniref:DEAD/DEAH box helicase n=1 Tax=Hyphomonas atlantica TaxID=1280948 RepID=UPI000C39BFB2|nr:helicase [Sphingorhabdus sp.]|tara:strand:- start:25443 stop:28391 length:2949 start_codon:yes stop_codon:yes gene_type:complete